jgi:hypothetical protein
MFSRVLADKNIAMGVAAQLVPIQSPCPVCSGFNNFQFPLAKSKSPNLLSLEGRQGSHAEA